VLVGTADLLEELHSRPHPLCNPRLEPREAQKLGSRPDGGGGQIKRPQGTKSDVSDPTPFGPLNGRLHGTKPDS